MLDGTARYPWRTRSGLLALIDAVAVLVNVGIVKAGEKLTTPTADPKAEDGAPLVAKSEAGWVTLDASSSPEFFRMLRRWMEAET